LLRLWTALGGWGLVVLLCVPAVARTTYEAHGGNCVAYARDVTGIHLDGDAASWWFHAQGRYDRGQTPTPGAVLVFKPYAGMRVGHVAVVSRVVSPREILVDQANWVRGRVTQAMSVIDASPLNDWTSVKVQFGGTHGRENPTYGFIYPQAVPASFAQTIVEPQPDRRNSTQVADGAAPHENAHDRNQTAQSDKPASKHRLAANEPATPHRQHKTTDAKVASVVY
jgi:surface antigen